MERYRYQEYAPWMLEDIGFDRCPGRRLLEVGVGMGSDHLQWVRGGALCTGIDLTPRCIEITRHRLAQQGLASDLRVMDAEQLDFPDHTFDVVYSFGVLHHTPGTQKAVDEIHRVLKPDGRAIVMLYHRDSWNYWVYSMLLEGIHRGKFEQRTLDELFGEQEEAAERKATPLVKTYSRAEAMFLFRRFRTVDTIVRQLRRQDLDTPIEPHLKTINLLGIKIKVQRRRDVHDNPCHFLMEYLQQHKRLSDRAIAELSKAIGWNVVVFAEK